MPSQLVSRSAEEEASAFLSAWQWAVKPPDSAESEKLNVSSWYPGSEPLGYLTPRRAGPLGVLAFISALLLVVASNFGWTATLLGSVILSAGTALGVVSLFNWIVLLENSVKVTSQDEFLLENAREDSLVQFKIYQDGVLTGSDRGVLWMHGNFLCFTGQRTSFALGLGDVEAKAKTVQRKAHGYACVWLRHPTRQVEVLFELLKRRETGNDIDVNKLRNRFLRVGASWSGSGQLPPLDVAPWFWKGIPDKSLRRRISIAFSVATIGTAIPLFHFTYGPALFYLVFMGGGSLWAYLEKRRIVFESIDAESP